MKSPVTFQIEEHPKEENPAPPVPQNPLRRGAPCPQCHKGRLDYNGLLELECPECGFSSSSGAGCT